MPRLWPLLIALPALVLWLAELSITASSLSAQAEQQATAYAARAVDAAAVRVAGRRAELQALTLRLGASPATWSTLEALRAQKGELAQERMAAVRRVAMDAVSTGLRNSLVLGLRTDNGGSYVRGPSEASPSLQGVEVDVLAGAGSDGQTRDAFGTYYLFFSVPLTGSDKDARALGTLMVGGPLLPDSAADQVAVELGLSAVGFVTGGKLGAAGGQDKALLAGALRETPVGKSAPVLRGAAGTLGPFKLPVFTPNGEATLRMAVRRSLPGQPVEVLALASLEPFMAALADAQRFALSCIGLLLLGLGVASVWLARTQPSTRHRADEDTVPPPRRATPPPRPSLVRVPEHEPEPTPLRAVPEPPPSPAPSPPSDFDAPPAALSAAVLDELEPPSSRPSTPPPSIRPGPSPVEDLAALLDAMPPPPPPRAQGTPALGRTPSAHIGGRFTPSPRAAPPPPPLDYDHQPTTAYPIPDLPDFNAPPAGFGGLGPMANAIPDTTRVADIPAELLQAAARPMTTPVPRPRQDEEHFHEVYLEFVAQREKCGESADGLTYERFATKLRKNRDQLVAKYACRTVRFQVYVKDGKAALKATPVKD